MVGKFVRVDDVEGVESRDPHDAIVTHAVDRDLGKTDAGQDGVVGHLADVVVDHLDAKGFERVDGKIDHLARQRPRSLVEQHVEGRLGGPSGVEGDPGIDDEAARRVGDGLQHVDGRRRHRFAEVHLPDQPTRRAEGTGAPGRGRVAVECKGGRIAGGERDLVAVVARSNVRDIGIVDGVGLSIEVIGRAEEHVELLIGRVLVERQGALRLEGSEIGADGRPVTRLLAVGVGDQPPGVRPDHCRVEIAGLREIVQRRGVQHGSLGIEESSGGHVHDPVAAPHEDQGVIGRGGIHHGRRTEVPRCDDGERLGRVTVRQRAFVDQRDHGVVVDDRSGEIRRAQRFGEIGPEHAGSGEPIALVLEIVAHDDGVDAEPSGDHWQRLGFEPPLG